MYVCMYVCTYMCALQLAHADVEELRKKLKTITEMHQVMEQQRDEETRKVDKLREQIEVGTLQGG